MLAHPLKRQGGLAAIEEPGRFARRRFGHSEGIDCVAVLVGSAVRGERTREAFDERLEPWAGALGALVGRDRWPARSTLSRDLCALDPAAVEGVRPLCLHDRLARPLGTEEPKGGIGGPTGEAVARLREGWDTRSRPSTGLAHTQRSSLPLATFAPTVGAWLDFPHAWGSAPHAEHGPGRAPPPHWLGRLGHPGKGHDREERPRALSAREGSRQGHPLPQEQALIRRAGPEGGGTARADLAGVLFLTGGKDSTLVDLRSIQSRLPVPADQPFRRQDQGSGAPTVRRS